MKKINVLIVDDHKLIRDGLKSIINSIRGINIIDECTNGRDAISYLEKNNSKIDVILMDITMPELNGIDATEIILKMFPNQKIIALTMHAEEAYIMKMIEAGALGYLLKDTSKQKLSDAIHAAYMNEKYYSNEVSIKLINLLIARENPSEANLTERETQVLSSIAKGNTNTKTAELLSISPRTVETHRKNIIKKLKVNNTAELISYAFSNGLV